VLDHRFTPARNTERGCRTGAEHRPGVLSRIGLAQRATLVRRPRHPISRHPSTGPPAQAPGSPPAKSGRQPRPADQAGHRGRSDPRFWLRVLLRRVGSSGPARPYINACRASRCQPLSSPPSPAKISPLGPQRVSPNAGRQSAGGSRPALAREGTLRRVHAGLITMERALRAWLQRTSAKRVAWQRGPMGVLRMTDPWPGPGGGLKAQISQQDWGEATRPPPDVRPGGQCQMKNPPPVRGSGSEASTYEGARPNGMIVGPMEEGRNATVRSRCSHTRARHRLPARHRVCTLGVVTTSPTANYGTGRSWQRWA